MKALAPLLAASLLACQGGSTPLRGGGTDGPIDPASSIELAPPPPFTADEVERLLRLGPLPAPPPDPTNAVEADPRAAQLGRLLFFEPSLSADGERSCATCHVPRLGWTDGLALPEGEREPRRHTPSLWNAAHQRWFFWDGRADSLWAQALAPFETADELGSTRTEVVRRVARQPELRRGYEALFGPLPPVEERGRFPERARPHPDQPDHPEARAWEAMAPGDRHAIDRAFSNLGKAIAAFERGLLTGETPFDRFLAGLRENDPQKLAALDAEARRGAQLFVGEARCHLCHSGPLLSDREFHFTGVAPLGRSEEPVEDAGRFHGIARVLADPFRGTGAFSDDPEAASVKLDYLRRDGHQWGEFKTPSLRNVALTAPYMHQGQLKSLEEVVRFYVTREGVDEVAADRHGERILVPLDLDEADQRALVRFLESLTDPGAPGLESSPALPGE